MLNFDLLLSQYLFQLGRDLPAVMAPFLASVLIWPLFVYVLYNAWPLPNNRERIIFLGRAAVAALACLAITSLIAHFYFRVRPFAALGFAPLITKSALEKSFPSDHAVVAWALVTILFLYNKKSGYIAAIAAILICLGRVLAGVHYVNDVLAGAGIGILVAWVIFKFSASAVESFRDGR